MLIETMFAYRRGTLDGYRKLSIALGYNLLYLQHIGAREDDPAFLQEKMRVNFLFLIMEDLPSLYLAVIVTQMYGQTATGI